MAHGTDLEKLTGLGLDTLGAVDDHHRAVGGHEGTVGILREVLVAGSIQDVNMVSLVLKLEHRGGDGDTSLFLDLHPVRGGVAVGGFALDRARGLDRASVEQEFLGEGGLTRVGVGDDGKGSALFDMIANVSHVMPFLYL